MVKISKKGQKAWVTFSIEPNEGENIALCGDWSDWKNEPMKKKKSGELYLTKVLRVENEYQFGYRVNESGWRCDSDMPHVESPFGSNNSVLKI